MFLHASNLQPSAKEYANADMIVHCTEKDGMVKYFYVKYVKNQLSFRSRRSES